MALKKLVEYIKKQPHVALGMPAILCFFTFITNLITALKDGNIDVNEYHTLLSTADGFEAVVMCAVMLAISKKRK